MTSTTPATAPADTPAALTIDIVSDVVCPWCFIGKRKLEAALESPDMAGLPPVQIRWHPFQLNPDLPAEGVPRKAYLEQKFGGPERAQQIYARVGAAANAVGLQLNFEGITQQANTLLAHALIAFAQAHPQNDAANTLGNAVKERILQANFIEGRFVGSIDVLVDIATAVGLDADEARSFLSDPGVRADVEQADAQARQMGVSGVPFFIFNNKVAVSGAQDPATLIGAMKQSLQ
ncbi:MAG: hypothetical protein RLZZ126_130 [Pseudomonadota bacterium]|jgi:predicted DsbA family dithiol-disulfide isomerase